MCVLNNVIPQICFKEYVFTTTVKNEVTLNFTPDEMFKFYFYNV